MGAEDDPGVTELGQGSLYRLSGPQQEPSRVVTQVSISNGLAWRGNTMYYIDSLEYSVDAFDYRPETGEISEL